MNPLAIIGWLISGVIIGLIARALMPGRQSMSLTMTMVLGVVGSLVGGLISWAMPFGDPNEPFHAAGWIMSIIGAIIVLAVAGMVGRKSA